MAQFISYSQLKSSKTPKARKFAILLVIVGVLAGVGYGGKLLLDKTNKSTANKTSEKAVTALVTKGTYESIKPYAKANFLGDITEADYNASAEQLTNLKDSNVKALNYSKIDNLVYVFGTIEPKDEATQGSYLFGFNATLQKTGINSYKITNIETDYGRRSYFDADRE